MMIVMGWLSLFYHDLWFFNYLMKTYASKRSLTWGLLIDS